MFGINHFFSQEDEAAEEVEWVEEGSAEVVEEEEVAEGLEEEVVMADQTC